MLGRPVRNTNSDTVVILVLSVATLVSALVLPVNPWPRDGWFRSQERLFGVFLGQDNYTPIAIPAIFFKINDCVSQWLGFDLRGEMYLASLGQNLLIFLSGVLVYRSCRLVSRWEVAAVVSVVYLIHVLSTGVAQAFWSEAIVIAMFAAVLYLNLAMHVAPDQSHRHFWVRAVLSSLLIGCLVVTRVTPILLIPALLSLLYFRLRPARFMGYATVTCLTTAALVLAMMASNQVRFGRFELTNSSGRHLWQGVTEIVDVALGGSPEFARLKEVNPGIQGKNHWEIQLPGRENSHSGAAHDRLSMILEREEVLKRLSTEAIRNAPLLFVKQGMIDFSKTIGIASYGVGIGERGGNYDPLNTQEPLPPLAKSMSLFPSLAFKAAARAIRVAYEIGYLLYPITILFVATSYVAILLNRVEMRRSPAGDPRTGWKSGKAGLVVFLLTGTALVGVIDTSLAASRMTTVERVSVVSTCVALLLWQATSLRAACRRSGAGIGGMAADSAGLYTFLAATFFGSLWFSWQVESNNTRNVLPYLPFMAVALAIALDGWARVLRRMVDELEGCRRKWSPKKYRQNRGQRDQRGGILGASCAVIRHDI